uniref:hypothetical protein n=1 Tax=Amycolatopsis sp. CA-290885 TaxID=3239925 RepID=UPI003F4989BE
MGREWTTWTAALAWAELLTELHRDGSRESWNDDLPDGTELRVTTMVGLAVQGIAEALIRRDPTRQVTDPHDLDDMLLAPLVELLVRRSTLHSLMGPSVGPWSSSDQIGLEQANDLVRIHREDILGWDTITQLCQDVGMWNLGAEGFRDGATLRDRRTAYQGSPIHRHAVRHQQMTSLEAIFPAHPH